MRFALLLAVSLLAACQAAPTKPNPPPAAVVTVPVATYVPIDAQLRKRCKWVKDAAPSAVFEVSNGRKRCLLQYEAQLDGIDQVQGKPVPDSP
ncbi:TPA: hypothetical protein ACKPW3_001659 [Stenotrophomonas maltophilia]|uniref:hypothetical protein n=1 Tax=Stenotrophomonas maltophilia TaxID=40324 RepID=UPI000C1623FE|nr:hypothetical protein [Stenotrophomonas maltophilia]MBH1523623.1 hypothetical protein [Stenotrophomonas maltophilia]MBH1648643.1 hypothetical protein [Stenotrophomonas maltophilia]MBH1754170.1 hypothetical protein [Stenotrophomonas maltophilia]MBH1811779.1 hypothetical protein [Stenotrophomonas maltophilia]MBH1889641.1 hypothetical protein [Stenotrophomonas maltophilia]